MPLVLLLGNVCMLIEHSWRQFKFSRANRNLSTKTCEEKTFCNGKVSVYRHLYSRRITPRVQAHPTPVPKWPAVSGLRSEGNAGRNLNNSCAFKTRTSGEIRRKTRHFIAKKEESRKDQPKCQGFSTGFPQYRKNRNNRTAVLFFHLLFYYNDKIT